MNKVCVVCQASLFGQQQKYCSNSCKQKDHYHRLKAQTNTYPSQTLRSLQRKMELIQQFGGRCTKCGYNKNVAALHFHHKDSGMKLFKLDMRILSNKKWSSILDEAKKCQLLCSNCHAEEHHPELNFHNIQLIISGASRKKLRDEQGVNSGKPSFPGNRENGNPEPSQANGK